MVGRRLLDCPWARRCSSKAPRWAALEGAVKPRPMGMPCPAVGALSTLTNMMLSLRCVRVS